MYFIYFINFFVMKVMLGIQRDPIRLGFAGTVLAVWILKSSALLL